MAPNAARYRSADLPPVRSAVTVVKWNGQRPGLLGHHVEGVVPAGDCAFNRYQRPAQGVFEPFPTPFPDGDGDQSSLGFQRQKHRFGQWPLAPYQPASHPHHASVAAALHRIAVQRFRPQQRAGQFHHLAVGAQPQQSVPVRHPLCPALHGNRRRHCRRGQGQLSPPHSGGVAGTHLPQRLPPECAAPTDCGNSSSPPNVFDVSLRSR